MRAWSDFVAPGELVESVAVVFDQDRRRRLHCEKTREQRTRGRSEVHLAERGWLTVDQLSESELEDGIGLVDLQQPGTLPPQTDKLSAWRQC